MKKIDAKKQGMSDTSYKNITTRRAIASAQVVFSSDSFAAFVQEGSPKGNILETARVAGIIAAKSTPQIIPLCHPLELSKVGIIFDIDKKNRNVMITSEVIYKGRTGVEMEALTAVAAAALTVYDMMKWKDKGIIIKDIRLMQKSGGKSGDYKR
ncbi:MAG: cyclic pyranopterin monophosphate synthase MoaC [Candidatus Omnitrophica bacterium]|nr:cyclic pyranopterin monophosphate synthase MoaC [Candidatus Omnitrophota bacterium]